MKKFITITAIVILFINFISIRSYATTDENGMFDYNQPFDFSSQETGQVTMITEDGQKIPASFNGFTYIIGLAYKAIVNVLTIVPQIVNEILDIFVEVTTEGDLKIFTIYDTVMGHYDIFNIDYLNVPTQLTSESNLIETMKYYVIKSYRITRNLSIAISLFVLIYVGIRMAISTVANDKAKYKKMLIYWTTSLVLVFCIHLIVILISLLLNFSLNIINNIARDWKVTNFEAQLFNGDVMYVEAMKSGFGIAVVSTVLYIWILAFYQCKFFMYYFRRTLEVNFLIIVSPLVTITYSIDKSGDNRAQAFEQFLKMLISKCSIQVLHAIVYVVFISTAGLVAQRHPILAIIFFYALSRVEKIAVKIFGIDEAGFQKIKVPFVNK
ncbi:MAG: hypothetical protein K6B70_08000 [Clostridia bacterium]|nr:hypothetical protein [Clostridia bacterium]